MASMAGMTISAWRERFPRLLFVEAIPLRRRPIRNVQVWQLRVPSLRSSRIASRGMVEEKEGWGGVGLRVKDRLLPPRRSPRNPSRSSVFHPECA